MLSSMPSARADRALSSCGPICHATASAALERRGTGRRSRAAARGNGRMAIKAV